MYIYIYIYIYICIYIYIYIYIYIRTEAKDAAEPSTKQRISAEGDCRMDRDTCETYCK